SMSHGLCMFDADGRIILFNDRYADLTGLPATALTGRTLVDVVKTRSSVSNPEEFAAEIRAPCGKAKPTPIFSRPTTDACSELWSVRARMAAGSRHWRI